MIKCYEFLRFERSYDDDSMLKHICWISEFGENFTNEEGEQIDYTITHNKYRSFLRADKNAVYILKKERDLALLKFVLSKNIILTELNDLDGR